MNPLRIGVAGVGHLGKLHVKMLADMPGVQLAGVFDTDETKAKSVAAEYGTRAWSTLDALMERVDAITVATTTTAHFAVASEALQRGVHVFLEKPITETVAEANEICRLARERNVIVQVGHIERFNPAILALEGFPLQPLFVESHRLAQFKPRGTDVAVVLDLMIHDIDLILTFVKSPVRQIDANGVAVVSDTIDIANARIQFESGCVANVTASRISQRAMRKMRLFQPNAYISLDFAEGMAEVFRLVGEDAPDVRGAMVLGEMGLGKNRKKIVYEQPEPREVNALRHELGLFVSAVANGTAPVVTADDARRALEVATSIMQKISQQQLPV
ncbi:MAG: putative dehydrogenase [Bacteroidetes bacterium]|jgi:predicted dehydrogenase|nr:putative dehydrogenase [Bacteroidota bacterium]